MVLLPMLHGKHEKGSWKWRTTIKIVNAVLVFCNSGQRNCLSEIWRWKLAVSVLHFLLYVCSETHNCKMSQKSAGPHFENCAFRVGRIAKTEKCKKWSSKISFDKKQPKRSTTKNKLPPTSEKQRFIAILQQKLKGTLSALYGQGSLETQKSVKSDLHHMRKCASHAAWELKSWWK